MCFEQFPGPEQAPASGRDAKASGRR